MTTIIVDNATELAQITAEYIRQGVTFNVEARGAGVWAIILTGGF